MAGTIDNVGSVYTAPAGTTTKKSNSQLGKDDFLKLLVTQLRYQDPMKPMEDKEFIAQMAQFSSLEQMKNIADGFEKFQSSQQKAMTGLNDVLAKFISVQQQMQADNMIVSAVSFVGKQLEATVPILDEKGNPVKDQDGDIVTEKIAGEVTAVSISNGMAALQVRYEVNGEKRTRDVLLNEVTKVMQAS
ncbi:flagellar hook capping protein, putative [Heliomicrobium modesticaldum Ice1]|uniref:Flagellar hook capping protein, putative n=1 Tax=Heliobacterium modesticaldum (strain ATCC 51547 / Ice1) TaxID=498761 RepID=B0THA9_HELMI|nr:flagellar hook capping FlgD N-terminal domain-containing protein [Heliomicrobium modesticaldum]ABZ84784.1 flagellar hook capping protein, putative [Heliomicrobium modesticaldum Ice1]